MKRLIIVLSVVCVLSTAESVFALNKKIDIMNGSQTDIYTLKVSPTNANQWEENLLQEETLKNGDKAMVEISRTENAEAWDITVTDKNGNESSWIGLPLDKTGNVTLLPDGQYLTDTDKDMDIDSMKKVMKK